MDGERLLNLVLASLMASITCIFAQICVYLGPIPYTMQNFAVVLSGLLLKPKYAFISQTIYIFLIALGLPVSANFRGGFMVIIGPTAGYLWSFPITSLLISIFVRPMFVEKRYFKCWLTCNFLSLIIYLTGTLWFYYWIINFDGSVERWAYMVAKYIKIPLNLPLIIMFTGALIFVPQDFLIDHVLAIIVAKYVYKHLSSLTMFRENVRD